MHERILVPLDGSSEAQIVLPYVGEIAARLGSEILLVSVSESKAGDTGRPYDSYLEHAKKQVQSLLEDYGAKEVSKVYSDMLLGKPADEVLRYSDENNASLIVMASRGSSGRGRWLLGTIAAKVLRATTRPVLLIRQSVKLEALHDKKLFKRILMPLDGSQTAEAAIPCTEVFAKGLGTELVLFQVVEPTVVISASSGISEPYPTPIPDETKKGLAIAYLEGVEKSLEQRGISTSHDTSLGPPADEIIDYARDHAIDLIAMSTHGRSGIGRWVFGSVTDKVLHAGDTAVLVVRAKKA